MIEKFNNHFYLRTSKVNKQGKLPIYVRITIGGKRKEFTTKQYINSKQWDPKMMKLKGSSEEARTINSYLENIKIKINKTLLVLEHQQTPLTLENFALSFEGKKKERVRTIIPIFEEHNKKVKSLIGTDFAEGTHERYETSLKHTKDFIRHQYGVSDLPIHKIDHAFITGYDYYLRTQRKCANNTTVKYIKNFKKIIRLCLANGWITQDPFLNYKTKLHQVERNILNEFELDQLIQKEISIERLDLVRDIFVFSCYTGLAYIDIKQLKTTNLVTGIDKNLWIHTHRQKTNTSSKIPLLGTALKIIEKYKENPKTINDETLLPIFSNQKMNAFLKEIATICGIKKDLTFHCARHTFATTVTLSNGVPIESVSKMLGHKSIKTTQHYAKITDRKVANDMDNLKAILDNSKLIQQKKTS